MVRSDAPDCGYYVAVCDDYHAGAENAHNARRIVACVNACAGLSDEQVAAIPQVLSLASELAAMVELLEEYQPGTDLFTVAEVLKLALAGARP